MADVASLVERVRLELADSAKFFQQTFKTLGDTNIYQLSFAPVSAGTCTIVIDGRVVPDYPTPEIEYSGVQIEESTGKIIFDFFPAADLTMTVTGTHYRYFTDPELTEIVNDAFHMHTHDRSDSFGRPLSFARLDPQEDYPLSVLAAVNALYVMLTDTAFDIDVYAPDGINIPRSQRHRQLMEMLQLLENRYRDLCMALGIGLYGLRVYTFRRISARTGRYVPVYRPQEIDDRRRPQRVYLPIPSYGGEYPEDALAIPVVDFVIKQGDTFSQAITLTKPLPRDAYVSAQIRTYPGSPAIAANLRVIIISPTEVIVSLSSDNTRNLPTRAAWELQMIVPTGGGLSDEFTEEFAKDKEYVETLVRGTVVCPRDLTTDTLPDPMGATPYGVTTEAQPFYANYSQSPRTTATLWSDGGSGRA